MTKSCFPHRALAVLLTMAGTGAVADPIPKAGQLDLRTAYKSTGEMHQVTDQRTYFFVTWLGISYNAAGTGLFHAAPVVCGGYLEMVGGNGASKGLCTFGEGPDRVHGEWSGVTVPDAPYEGAGRFTGGTGRFVGVTGGWKFKCRPVNLAAGQWSCDQKVDYKLP
jgi:hypothetical protein